MSKIAEKRTDEIIGEFHDGDYTDHSGHNTQWVAFKQGYDQALQDLLKDANQYRYLSNEIGYAYACGCRKTMQDFLEKACKWLEENATYIHPRKDKKTCIVNLNVFKEAMEEE